MIVKIKLLTEGLYVTVYVTNRDLSLTIIRRPSIELVEKIGTRDVAYFYTGLDSSGKLAIGASAPEQDW